MGQDNITDLRTYMRAHANELGERILSTYPALHQVDDPPSPRLGSLLRQPFPAQTLAIMGIVKRWNEARTARRGSVVRDGLRTTLTDLRLCKGYPSARKRWESLCGKPALFIVGRDRAKLGYFWRHAYRMPRSGRYRGCVVNPASGAPVMTDEGRLTGQDFEKVRISEVLTELSEKGCRGRYAPLWQADNQKIPRVAPVDFISRYMGGFFDCAICDELHQLRSQSFKFPWTLPWQQPTSGWKKP